MHAGAWLWGWCGRLGRRARGVDAVCLVTDDNHAPVPQAEDGVGITSRHGVDVGVFGWDHIDVIVVAAPTKDRAVVLHHQRELIPRADLLDIDGRRRH